MLKFWKNRKIDIDTRYFLFEKYSQISRSEFEIFILEFIKDHNLNTLELQKSPQKVLDQNLVGNYVDILVNLSDILERNGYPELKMQMSDPLMNESIEDIKVYYAKAIELVNVDKIAAITLLLKLEIEIKQYKGPFVDIYYPRILGLLGLSYFKEQEMDKAKYYTIAAYDYCKRINDIEGMETYSNNLTLFENPSLKQAKIDICGFAGEGNVAEAERANASGTRPKPQYGIKGEKLAHNGRLFATLPEPIKRARV